MAKEKKLLEDFGDFDFVAGIDEVGRGCGAGPVVTAAVIMPKGFKSVLIRDSKKLSPTQRQVAYELIMLNAVSVSCHAGSVNDINEMGIDKATYKTMYKCLSDLSVKPDHILVDGISWQSYDDEINYENMMTLVPKGDDTYTCIAAAAIVAKVRRDEYMEKLGSLYPEYNWGGNKGYLTPDHIAALKEIGHNKYHRTKYIRNFVK
jgi:ribonuclease HII